MDVERNDESGMRATRQEENRGCRNEKKKNECIADSCRPRKDGYQEERGQRGERREKRSRSERGAARGPREEREEAHTRARTHSGNTSTTAGVRLRHHTQTSTTAPPAQPVSAFDPRADRVSIVQGAHHACCGPKLPSAP